MILRENHEINALYTQRLPKPSEVLKLHDMQPDKLEVAQGACVNCGDCGEESAEELATDKLDSENETYSDKVDTRVDGLSHVFDLIDAQKTKIQYNIDIDYATWGINGISVHPTGTIEVVAECTKYGDGDSEDTVVNRTFKVDLDKLKVHYDAAQVIGPKELQIYIGPDHEVLYTRSSLTFHYLSVRA